MAKHKKNATPAISTLETSLERFHPLLSEQEFGLLLDELKIPLRSAIRLNPLKTNVHDLERWKKDYGWDLDPVPFCKTGFQVNSARIPPSQTLEHRMGMFYIQDAASMLPVELFSFDANSHPLILDLAASPGGKTTHLIANSNDHGFVLANDSSRDRIQALRIILQTWGGVSSAVSCFPGERFGQWFPETFEHVLLDAPCSMEGLRATEAHPLRPISDRERDSLARRQEALLESALQSVKIGGQVVYSTCTLAPEEDENVVDRTLRKFKNQIQIEIPQLSEKVPPALPGYNGNTYLPETAHALRLWPHMFHTAGFFAARFTKTDFIESHSQPYPQRTLEAAGWNLTSSRDVENLTNDFQTEFGFDIKDLLERYDLSLWQKGSTYYLFPNLYHSRFTNLPVQMLGIQIAERTEDGVLPGFDFCSRFFGSFYKSILTISASDEENWFKGSDLQRPSKAQDMGRFVLLADEINRFIGLGKVNRDRIKNLLPRRLIRNTLSA